MEILAATKNNGKITELKIYLAGLSIRLRGLDELPRVVEPEETGATFAENAVLKARYYALRTNLWSLADDSGLEVAALGGAPGVFSARFAGANASDAENIEKLLQELNKIPGASRCARFVCSMAICDANGAVKFTAEDYCAGKIVSTAKGANGFGYDPIFVPDGFDETFGEMSAETKRKISHRARAVKKMIRYLRSVGGSA